MYKHLVTCIYSDVNIVLLSAVSEDDIVIISSSSYCSMVSRYFSKAVMKHVPLTKGPEQSKIL